MDLGTATTGFQVTRRTGASFRAEACRFATPLQPGTTHLSFSTVRLWTLFLGSLNTKQLGTKHQTYPWLAVHVPVVFHEPASAGTSAAAVSGRTGWRGWTGS
jgi:hypothetical protein